MRSLTGPLSKVLSTLYTSNLFKQHNDHLSRHITHTTSCLKPFMVPYYSAVTTKQKTPLNMIHTIWPFLQLLSHIVPLSVLQPYWPFSGFLVLAYPAPRQGLCMCFSLWIILSILLPLVHSFSPPVLSPSAAC